MSDRTVYYPDLDWPRNNAPANYIPIREGGGTTTHGNGAAVGEITLGGRTIRAISLYEHTPGSTGYLDTENNLIATGDAIGSGYVWAHFGLISQYAETVRHLQDVLRPMNNPAVLPAHFYQVDEASRGPAPIRGRPLDKQYVDDEVAAAEGVLNGTVVGEPYGTVGRNVVIAKVDTGQMTYGLNTLFPPNTADRAYHAIQIPGWSGTVDFAKYPMSSPNIKTNFLADTRWLEQLAVPHPRLCEGAPAWEPEPARRASPRSFTRLIGSVTARSHRHQHDLIPAQIGGLMQFAADKVYVPKGATEDRPG